VVQAIESKEDISREDTKQLSSVVSKIADKIEADSNATDEEKALMSESALRAINKILD
jgi:hypothetical protein